MVVGIYGGQQLASGSEGRGAPYNLNRTNLPKNNFCNARPIFSKLLGCSVVVCMLLECPGR